MSCLELLSSVLDLLHVGFSLFTQSSSRCEPAPLISDCLRPGLTVPLRSHSRLSSSLPVTGMFRPDPLSPVLNFADPGPSLSPRSPAQPDMVALVMDMLQLDTSLLPQSHYQPGSGMLAFGLSRPGSVSLLSVVASANLEPSLSLQSAGRTEALLPVPDFLHPAFPASCRSLTRSSLPFPALRTVDFEVFLPVLDYVQYDPALFVRSFTHLDVFILVPDLLTLGPLLSARMLVRTDSVPPASGKFSFGPSSVSVLNKVFFDLAPSAKSFACLGPVASTPDFLEPEPSTFLRTFARAGSTPSALGCSRPGDSPLASDSGHFGPGSSLQSYAHLESTSLALDLLNPGLLPLLRECIQTDLMLLAFKASSAEPTLPAPGSAHPGPILPLQSLVCQGLSLTALKFAHLGFLVLLRQFNRLDTAVFASGASRAGSALLASGSSHLGPFSLSRSLVQASPATSVCGLAKSDSSPPPRSFSWPDSEVLATGMSRPGFALVVLDSVRLGSSMLLHTFSCCGSVASVLNLAKLGSPLPLRSSARAGSSAPLSGNTCPGLMPFVPNRACLEISAFLRSCSCLEAVLIALGSGRLGVLLSSQGSSRLASSLSVVSVSRLGPFLSVSENLGTGFFSFLQSRARLGAPVLVLSGAGSGSALPSQSFARTGLALFVVDFLHSGFFLPLRSCLCLESASPASDPAKVDSTSPLHQFSQVDMPVLLAGFACVESVSLPSVVDAVHLGFPLSLRSMSHAALCVLVPELANTGLPSLLRSWARIDSTVPVSKHAHPGSTAALQSVACTGLTSTVLGVARLDLALLATSIANSDAMLSLRSLTQAASSVSVPHTMGLGSLPSSQGFSGAGFAIPPLGLSWLGSVFPLPVIASAQPGPVPSPRSCAKAGFPASALGVAGPEVSLPLRSSA